ncbi:MAG: creatininase family protein [Candidatus Humimicrobiaceae bacterium]
MKLEFSFPSQTKQAQKNNDPLVIPIGTIEYHGPHCAYGCDGLIAQGLAEKLSETKKIMVAPTIWYSPASYAVAGMDAGSVHIDVDCFEDYVYYTLKSFLYSGWKNIYLLIHHQYEEENLLPMTLACMKASKKLIFEYLDQTKGLGWWGKNENRHFYENLNEKDNPWKWITVLPCMSKEVQHVTGYDHAGKWECSILSALYPKAVVLENLSQSDDWFIQSAAEASIQIGQDMVEKSMQDLLQKII